MKSYCIIVVFVWMIYWFEDEADRSKRIYWDVRCLLLRNALAQNPKNVMAYKKLIQYFVSDRIGLNELEDLLKYSPLVLEDCYVFKIW